MTKHAPWTCRRCGEQIEHSFRVCWNCGTDVDGNIDPNFRHADARTDRDLISPSDLDWSQIRFSNEMQISNGNFAFGLIFWSLLFTTITLWICLAYFFGYMTRDFAEQAFFGTFAGLISLVGVYNLFQSIVTSVISIDFADRIKICKVMATLDYNYNDIERVEFSRDFHVSFLFVKVALLYSLFAGTQRLLTLVMSDGARFMVAVDAEFERKLRDAIGEYKSL